MSEITDLYPSRVDDKPGMMDRRDPVVYGEKRNQHPLSAQQLKSYEKNGFLLLVNHFSMEEMVEYQEEAKRLAISQKNSASSAVITEPDSGIVRSVFNIHQSSEVFKKLSSNRRLVGMVSQILDSEVYIHQSRINYKPAFDGKEFYWHSDFETWHIEDGMPRMRAVSCSIFLTKNTSFNGALMLIPGSHKKFVSCVGKTPEKHYEKSLKKQEYGVPDHESITSLATPQGLKYAEGLAGSVVLFDCNTLHGSGGNISPWPRNSVFFVYNSVENTLLEPFGAPEPRPEFIASRDFSPIEQHKK